MVQKAFTFLVMIGILLIPIGIERHTTQVVAQGDEPPMMAKDPFVSSHEAPSSQSKDKSGIVVTEIEGEFIDPTLLPQNEQPPTGEEEGIILDQDIQTDPALSTQVGSNPELTGEERSSGLGVLDNFNRSDGSLGIWWTLQDGICSISGNLAYCGDKPGVATFKGAPGDGNAAEMDVAVNGTALQYAALILNYGGGSHNLFIKVQQDGTTGFDHGACYYGGVDAAFGMFGLEYFPLTSSFSNAHMRVIRTGDTVTIKFTHVDYGAQPDQTYICTGAPSPDGTGIGIGGYANQAQMDNFSIPRGPRVLLLEADYDETGTSDIQTALEGFGDISDVDMFDAENGTPTLSLLQSYDVVIAWSNFYFDDATAIGNVLADYVDSGGKVINMMFSLLDIQGRFMNEDYTAIKAVNNSHSLDCLGSYHSTHPLMVGITDICDEWRLVGTYLTPSSTPVAYWSDGELFVAAKNDRSVASIVGYIGNIHSWTGQMEQLLHNAIYWLYSGNKILWNQSQTTDEPTSFCFNQYTQDYPDLATFVADDIILQGIWKIESIFVPGRWDSETNLAHAHEIVFSIYENDGGVPAGDPMGGGDPPIWEVIFPINSIYLTIFSGEYGATTNIFLDLPSPLTLSAGHYWLVMFPVMNFEEFGQIHRVVADTANGITAQLINPGNYFGFGTDWTNLSTMGATKYDLAFRIEGESYSVFIPLVEK